MNNENVWCPRALDWAGNTRQVRCASPKTDEASGAELGVVGHDVVVTDWG